MGLLPHTGLGTAHGDDTHDIKRKRNHEDIKTGCGGGAPVPSLQTPPSKATPNVLHLIYLCTYLFLLFYEYISKLVHFINLLIYFRGGALSISQTEKEEKKESQT